MNARAALFDLYGDHLRSRGGRAPVSALVELLGTLDVAAPAVRTAVSRMVRQGWLAPVRDERGSGYAATDRARQRLDEAAARIFRSTAAPAWDGRWSVLVVEPTRDRTRRDRTGRGLQYLGYRLLRGQTWVAPRPAAEAEDVVRREGLHADRFDARLAGDDRALLDRLYDVEVLAAAYRRWRADAAALLDRAPAAPDDRTAFALRARLLHEWRKFLFSDPGLPGELLPAPWPGVEAAAYFNEQADRLWPAASRFVDRCLAGGQP